MTKLLNKQTDRFLTTFGNLVRAYQFRDRDKICCHDLSVTQWYALEKLCDQGPLTMGKLAAELFLDGSTVTRVVEQLVAGGLAARRADPSDRRVVLVEVSADGERIYHTAREELHAEYSDILRRIPASSRQAVVVVMEQLLDAFRERNKVEEDHVQKTPATR